MPTRLHHFEKNMGPSQPELLTGCSSPKIEVRSRHSYRRFAMRRMLPLTDFAQFLVLFLFLITVTVAVTGQEPATKSADFMAGTWILRPVQEGPQEEDRKSTRLNSSHSQISYAVFCLK